MPRVVCPACSVEIPPDDVNVGENVAYCRTCGGLTQLDDIAEGFTDTPEKSGPPEPVGPPPPGCRLEDNGVEIRVIASARSVGGAAGSLFAALFWNGIVGVFVLIAIAGTLHHTIGRVPSWFPAPPMSGGNAMPLGMVIFMWIFLTPFMFIGAALIAGLLTTLGGRNEVRLRGHDGAIITGIGPLVWKRRFDAGAVKEVRIGKTSWKENNRSKPCIVIEAARTHRFGNLLSRPRREWMGGALEVLLVTVDARTRR